MKNIFKTFSVIVMVALIAFAFTACQEPEEDPGNDNVQKTLVITNIPVTALPTTANSTSTSDITGKQITVALCNKKGGNGANKNDYELYAYNTQTANATGTVTIPLISRITGDRFTGTGPYFILLWFDINNTTTGENALNDDIAYVYTEGAGTIVTYPITGATSSIGFDQFKFIP